MEWSDETPSQKTDQEASTSQDQEENSDIEVDSVASDCDSEYIQSRNPANSPSHYMLDESQQGVLRFKRKGSPNHQTPTKFHKTSKGKSQAQSDASNGKEDQEDNDQEDTNDKGPNPRNQDDSQEEPNNREIQEQDEESQEDSDEEGPW